MYNSASRTWALGALSGLILMAACTDTSTLPTEVEVQFAKGGKPGKPGGGGGDSFSYTITDLGGEGASGINNTAVVGGRLGEPSPTFGTRRAVLWDAGTSAAQDLMQLTSEANFSWAYAINSAGQVVGESNRVADEWPATPVIWDVADGTIRVLLELADQYTSQVYGINESGQAVGYRRENDGTFRNQAVLWDTDGTITITELGGLPGHDFSWAQAINNAGQVVGLSRTFRERDSERAVLWEPAGGPLNLDPSGNGMSDATDISEPDGAGAVQVVGTATTGSGVRVATVWIVKDGSVVGVRQLDAESGNASSAHAVNDVGQVVVNVSGGVAVWTSATDLLEPLPSLSKHCSSGGHGINNDGTVAGSSGTSTKGRCTSHAVIWTTIN